MSADAFAYVIVGGRTAGGIVAEPPADKARRRAPLAGTG